MKVTFNAFSFLKLRLAAQDLARADALLELREGTTTGQLRADLGLAPEEVEAIFVNGRIRASDVVLHDRDRVALVPPGTPGPYRVLLGMVKPSSRAGSAGAGAMPLPPATS